ncbi:uncharacterized protein IUM83_03501 [Phytophthora cinnamomi]|uniref:uncharacterized protein n=1 Tax=Phytophthora cinnamomi TaxID=4785 RepID=UPI00355A4C96|nr:hypothetical protein IUM83_03501 [Phytophthora cinnamomi]
MAPTSRGGAAASTPANASLKSPESSDVEDKRSPNAQGATPMSSPQASDDSETRNDEHTSAKLSPRSRRRQKNRDQMRLARQKERDTMQQLRDTVHRLEVRYQETVNRGILPPPNATSASPSEYVKLIEEGARLQDENFRFRRALHEKNKLQETLERVYDDFHQPATQEETSMRRCVFEEQCAHDPWNPLTEEETWTYVRATHERVASAMQAISRRAAQQKMDPTIRPLPPFLGWQVRYHRENDEVLFSFEKPFYHVTALHAMQHTWTNELTMQSYRKPVDAAAQSMAVFQVINDDTYVFRRRIRVREKVVTSHYLRFRLKTNSGYAIGNCSVNRKPCQQEGQIWAAKLSLWTDFNALRSEFDQEYCVVRITGRMSVDATEAAASQAAVDIILGLLRWENLNIGPVFTFAEG